MQNCWRAIFKLFGKFLECIVHLHNCWRCSKVVEELVRFFIRSQVDQRTVTTHQRQIPVQNNAETS